MKKLTKQNKIILGSTAALVVIIILGIVYAAFSQQLNINGSAVGRKSSWDIHFANLQEVNLTGTAKELTTPSITGATTIGTYSVSVTSPGDTVSYTFDVVNDGDYDATISSITVPTPSCNVGGSTTTDSTNVCNKLSYTLKYSSGATVQEEDTLASKETKTMVLTLTYNTFNDHTLLPSTDVTITNLGVTITYAQDGNAKVNANGTTPYVAPQPAYVVGDLITVAGEQYRVIAASGTTQDYVTALKVNPLKASEITAAGGTVGYTYEDTNATGGMAYYMSSTCNGDDDSGCTTVYAMSTVKSVVDSWASSKFTNSELKTVGGYDARLITLDELLPYYPNCSSQQREEDGYCDVENTTPSWLYSSVDVWYWTMSQYPMDSSSLWVVSSSNLGGSMLSENRGTVRPVINVYKNKITR